MITPRGETILLTLAFASLLAVLCGKTSFGPRVSGRPAIADNERMLNAGDAAIVGDSNVYNNPVSRASLANTRFGVVPTMPAPLRQTTQGRQVSAEIGGN